MKHAFYAIGVLLASYELAVPAVSVRRVCAFRGSRNTSMQHSAEDRTGLSSFKQKHCYRSPALYLKQVVVGNYISATAMINRLLKLW